MSLIIDALQGLGAGQRLIVAAVLGLVVMYLLKGRSLARRIAGTMGTLTVITVGVLVTVSAAILLGWVNPQPSVFFEHVRTGLEAVGEVAVDEIASRIEGVSI